MAIGYKGPRKKPIKDIAMALPIREGVSDIIISKLFDFVKKKKRKVNLESFKSGFNF